MATTETAASSNVSRAALAQRRRWNYFRQTRAVLAEYLTYDARPLRCLLEVMLYLVARVLYACGKREKGLKFLCAVHRSGFSRWASAACERFLKSRLQSNGSEPALYAPLRRHIECLAPTPPTARSFEKPEILLENRAIVLKSPGENEKGVLLLDYSFVFPAFARFYDIGSICKRYHLVLEPSWSGYCDPDILCYLPVQVPVFVEAFEPRDAAFVASLKANLIPVPLAANWWVDHRVMRPLPGIKKDIDVVMLASWATFKRHHRFFAALSQLKKQGHALRCLLIGYPVNLTLADIRGLAAYYGIEDQVECREWLGSAEVNEQLNRARVNIVWSRKEGVNRAIIEGMFAGVPCMLRQGFNYGHEYFYVNKETGCFAGERELPERLLWMVRHHAEFQPRDWVLAHMSCQRATAILEECVRAHAVSAGENWTRGLAVKVGHLNGMQYWDPADKGRFESDYDFLRSKIRAKSTER